VFGDLKFLLSYITQIQNLRTFFRKLDVILL